jgi:hypothetical protein
MYIQIVYILVNYFFMDEYYPNTTSNTIPGRPEYYSPAGGQATSSQVKMLNTPYSCPCDYHKSRGLFNGLASDLMVCV